MRHPTLAWLSMKLDPFRKIGRKLTYSSLYPVPVLESTARTISCRPALFNPEHLSRVTTCAFGKTLPELTAVLSATSYVEGPLATFQMGEATVLGGTIFTKTNSILHSSFVKSNLQDTLGSAPIYEETVLANSMQGLRYFGHWLSDDVSAFEAFHSHPNLLSLPLPSWSDMATYSQLFDQNWNQKMVIRTRSLTLVRDLGFSERKAQRYRSLRSRLRSHFNVKAGAGKVVFLRRGPSGDPREIVNSAELEQRLSAAGVSIVTAEGGNRDFIASLIDAAVIITIEGSQDRHALYALKDGGGMLTLLPPDRFYVATHEWARNLEMHSGMVIGKNAKGGFIIDPDEVLQMVDRLLPLAENRVAG